MKQPLAKIPTTEPTESGSGLIQHEAITAYHHAKVQLDEFCRETDENRKLFNAAHEQARQAVFGLTNQLLCTEPTIFEVAADGEELKEPVFYLVTPGQAEIQRVKFNRASAVQSPTEFA